MTGNEEQQSESENVTERNPQVNMRLSEIPGRSYRISMEVPMFLSMMSVSLSGVAVNNIVMYRTCVHALHHNMEACRPFLAPDKSNVSQSLEIEVQKYVTLVSTVKIILESIGPAILSFFLGVWSDTYGRKPLVVWSLFGMTMSSMMTVVYSMLEGFGPWWYILTSIPYSFTGGFTVLFTGAMCYMTDITTTQNRSLRITIIEAVVSVGSVIGGVASSYLLKSIGNVYLLTISSALLVIAYAFTTVYVQESLTGAIQGGVASVLDFLLVKEMMRECFKRRPNRGRAQILLLTFANTLSIFILYGLISLEYLYSREKLHWSMKEYTIFSSSSTMISFVGSFIGVGLIQRILPVSDLVFSIIAFLSSAADYFIKAFATLSWHMYLGSGVSLFRGLSSPLIRSFLSKILPVEDIAKVFALMGAIEGICPLFSPLIYNSLYNVTIVKFPGAIYILSCGIALGCTVMLGIVQYYRWRTPSTPSYQQWSCWGDATPTGPPVSRYRFVTKSEQPDRLTTK